MTRWCVLLAAASVVWAQSSIDRLDTAKKLLESDPAAALDYATKSAASDRPVERWFWPIILEAQAKLGNWDAAAEIGAKSAADIENGRMFTRIDQIRDEIRLRQLYATALDQRGKADQARQQRAIADLLSSANQIGDARAQAIVAAEQALRIKYAKADLLATEGNEVARLIRVKDLEGRVVDLHDRRGKIAIVLFWATWCAPCMQELDALNRIYPRLRDRADVKAVNVDDKLEVVRELAKNHDLAFPIFTSEGSQVTLYTNAATIQDPNIPQLYVIDRAGSVRFHLTGFDDDGVFAQRLDWMLGAIK